MATTTKEKSMSKTMVDQMVERFLTWSIPADFAPDAGISFAPLNRPNSWPTGTNLMTAVQAKGMVEYMLTGITPLKDYSESEGEAYTIGFVDGMDEAKRAT